MPEPELFLLFVRPLNRAGIRYVKWITRRGLQKEWRLVSS
jgi:hypothetical protein